MRPCDPQASNYWLMFARPCSTATRLPKLGVTTTAGTRTSAMKLGILIAAALTVATPAAAQTVAAGVGQWQKGDHAAAIAVWTPLAARGDPDAAFNLGQAYRLGKGVPLDLARAQTYFETAARKDHVDAATTLGLLLFQNGNRTA